ncbi:Gln-synt_C domain-containing protein/Amidohydro_2 domain-containing protein [Cephalotus follicularis]|uniref:Gln-synt_C domain-containing protein/Amidohydro_2 domain-containing protein n=1 Tax=Cephalotus follicularis TaxID=3775 RepID=A0A1Q3CZV4_CEPFO|nr:Gln-synt_C domain-containing protein/Amidohydro_2 domain-containing protein [Cephalotus follicularis]
MEIAELKEAIEKMELVDGHAHNIVDLDSTFSFIKCFTEADGDDALSFAPHSLSFKRSLREIAELYGCEPTLQAIEEYRKSSGLQSISSACFKAAKISAILIDDGLKLHNKQDLPWHKSFAPVIGRILRIESLAEEILERGMSDGSTWTLDLFTETFVGNLKSLANKIVGLKSIAAYRSGLKINTQVSRKDAEGGLSEVLRAGKPIRITNKSFIDYIFTCTLEVALCFDFPLQIHSGFGDKDLDLRLANPLHLRTVLEDERFLKCRIVLLHASYPFTKEASYLASVYPQVYLDFGLAIPKLSVNGMRSSVRELLELAPIKKVMFSTDGYAFPETYYLGARKSREVVFSVLHDACIDGDLSVAEAIEAATDIFAQNAIQFYKITLSVESFGSKDSLSRNSIKTKISAPEHDVSLVRILWVDASGQHRCRVVPGKRFNDVIRKNGVGLTFACMAMSSAVDGAADDTNLTGVGEIRLMPDLSTRWTIPWTKNEDMVLADMHIKPGEAWEYCPREALRRVSKVLKDEYNLVMNAGFESEFYLLKSVLREGKEEWVPIDSTPYCSSSGFDAISPLFHEIISALHSLNITVEQLHAEAGKGQFELALGHTVCTYAADNLIFTREVIKAVARKHGLLATFVPKYALDDIGSGSHVHVSLWQNGKNVFMASAGSSRHGMSNIGEEFMAGVLYHLPSILAFTAPVPNSYDRIQPNTWSGAYQCWGKENREAPLRTACPPGISEGYVSNFEIKCFDGCANSHLGLAAIIAAGIDGLRRHLHLPEPIDINPSGLDATLQRLPESLSESLEALQKDDVLHDLIGKKLLVAIKGIRKAEIEYYSKNKDGYKQLIHRY